MADENGGEWAANPRGYAVSTGKRNRRPRALRGSIQRTPVAGRSRSPRS